MWWLVSLLSLTALADAKFPHAELTRYVSPMGMEHLTLRCFADRTAKDGYSCELTQQRNGVVLASALLAPNKVDAILTRYFERTPKEKILSAESDENGSVRGRGDLTWQVNFKALMSRGSHQRGSQKDQSAMIAVLALENELSTSFLR